jgi:glycerol-3-phosphate O-acyltransferase
MSEPRYLDTNPWPATDAAPVLFILDAGNRVEQGLLESWLQKHRPEWGDKASQVSIPIGSGEKSVGTRALQQALDASPDTLVVPLRVTWLPPEEYFDSGPRLRHLLLGDPRRPGALRGRRILRKQPQRVNCIAGAAATIVDLQSRGQRRLGNDAPSPEAFANFVVRQAGEGEQIPGKPVARSTGLYEGNDLQSATFLCGFLFALQQLCARPGLRRPTGL